jgi:hypothetical protein
MIRGAVSVLALVLGGFSESPAGPLTPVSRADLCVTEGAVGERPGMRLSVDTDKMRAYLNRSTRQSVDARFTYLGPTAAEARLGSGELRRQFGLKLRAADACNLVYVMWRIQPASKLVVSVKTNSLEHTSSQCGNRGYRNIKPRRAATIEYLKPGETHSLRADMSGAELRVSVDNSVVWEGSLGPEAAALEGPVGIRSDNARLLIELRAGETTGTPPPMPAACRSNSRVSEP